MLVIQKIDPIYADFTVTENDLTRVRHYMSQGTLKVEAELPQDVSGARAHPGLRPLSRRRLRRPHRHRIPINLSNLGPGN